MNKIKLATRIMKQWTVDLQKDVYTQINQKKKLNCFFGNLLDLNPGASHMFEIHWFVS